MQENTFLVTSQCNAFYITHLASGEVACLGDGADRMSAMDVVAEEYIANAYSEEVQALLRDIVEHSSVDADSVAADWTEEANELAVEYSLAYFFDPTAVD